VLKLKWVVFFCVFLFTLKFELINNLILLMYALFNLDEIKIKKRSLTLLIIPVLVLLVYSQFFYNVNYAKYCIYAFRLLLILHIANQIIKSNKISTSSILEKIFFLHVSAVLLCYFFPPINNFFTSVFSYSGGSRDRFSGFIQGYEFVPFVLTIYLTYEYLNIDKKLDAKFVFKLVLGTLASLLSGRYSVIPLTALIGFIALSRGHIPLKVGLFSTTFLIFISVFDSIFANISNTLYLLKDAVIFGLDHDFSKYSRFSEGGVVVEGQYNLSPITLAMEAAKPFLSWNEYIMPSSFDVIDSGPSYVILNLGFLLSCYLYVFYFKSIAHYSKSSVPMIVVIVFLTIDIKFKSIFVLLPTCWLVVNHFNYTNQLRDRSSETALFYK